MAIDEKLLDELLANYKTPEDIIGENGLLKQMTKALLERAMNAELSTHLGFGKHDPSGYNSGNSRNGVTKKKLKGDFGEIDLETPRDRAGTFVPQIVAKGQTRFTGFDAKIISMYARGLSRAGGGLPAGVSWLQPIGALSVIAQVSLPYRPELALYSKPPNRISLERRSSTTAEWSERGVGRDA